MAAKSKYNEIMDKITVTDDMRRRILQNLDEADYGQSAEPQKRSAIFFSRWKESAALAACVALLFAGVLAMPSILNRQSSALPAQSGSAPSQPRGSSYRQFSAPSSEASSSESEEATSTTASSSQVEIIIHSANEAQSSSASPKAESEASSAEQSAAASSQPAPSSAQPTSDSSSEQSAAASSSQAASTLPQPDLGETVSLSDWAQLWAQLWGGSSDSEPDLAATAPDSTVTGTNWFAAPDISIEAEPPLAEGTPAGDGADAEVAEAFIQCSSRSELAAITGFEVEGISFLPFAATSAEYLAIDGGRIAQITYTTSSGQTACWRKAAGVKNISGVSTADVDTKSFSYQNMKITLAGTDGDYSSAWWTNGSYSWSLVLPQGLSLADWETLLEYTYG